LEIVADSDLKVEIVNSYFRGSHYLIEAKFVNEVLFFENDFAISKGIQVCLKMK
jgi:hypothetical protein